MNKIKIHFLLNVRKNLCWLKNLKFLFILSQPKQSDRNKASSGHYKQQVDWKFYTKWYKVVGCFLSVWSLRSWYPLNRQCRVSPHLKKISSPPPLQKKFSIFIYLFSKIKVRELSPFIYMDGAHTCLRLNHNIHIFLI